MKDVLAALLSTEDPPTNYGLTEADVASIASCYDWETRVTESNWSQNTDYNSLAEMVKAEPQWFLADISRFYGDDYYLVEENWTDDMDGDAASALASAGFGTDEDYGCFDDGEF